MTQSDSSNSLVLPDIINRNISSFYLSSPSTSPLLNSKELSKAGLDIHNVIKTESFFLVGRIYTYVLFKAYLNYGHDSKILESYSVIKMAYDFDTTSFCHSIVPQSFFATLEEAEDCYNNLTLEIKSRSVCRVYTKEDNLSDILRFLKSYNSYCIYNPLQQLQISLQPHHLGSFCDNYLNSSDKVKIKDKEYNKVVLLEPMDFTYTVQLSIVSSNRILVIQKNGEDSPSVISNAFRPLIDSLTTYYSEQLVDLKGTILQIVPARPVSASSNEFFDNVTDAESFYKKLFDRHYNNPGSCSFPQLSKEFVKLKVVDILMFQGKDVSMLPWYQRRHIIRMIFDYLHTQPFPPLSKTIFDKDYIRDGLLQMTDYTMCNYEQFIHSYIKHYFGQTNINIGQFSFHDYDERYVNYNYEFMSSWRTVKVYF